MTILFENEYGGQLPFPAKELAQAVIVHALDYENCPYEAQVDLLLTNNQKIRALNCEYRNIDKETDVLSFPLLEFLTSGDFSGVEEHQYDCFHPESGELMMGDIIISAEKMFSQAEAYGHSPKREFAFLIAHSMLHLMGYDHIQPEEAGIMEAKQDEILTQLGIIR